MARKSFTRLRYDAGMPAVVEEDESPVYGNRNWSFRGIRDLIDTLQPGYAVMLIEGDQTFNATTTPQVLTSWTDAPIVTREFEADPVTGLITVNDPMVLRFTLNLTVEFGNAEEAIAQISRTGTVEPSFYTGSVPGRGPGKAVALSIEALFDVPESGEQFEVRIANQSGIDTYTFKAGALVAQYIPLINTPTMPITKVIP